MEGIVEKFSTFCLDEGDKYADESGLVILERAQVFTPTNVVVDMLAHIPEDMWEDGKTFIDPECGIGQMVVPVAIIKKELGHTNALATIYGVELYQDNVDLCRSRLLDIFGHDEVNIKQVRKNIVCTDSLTYDFEFS